MSQITKKAIEASLKNLLLKKPFDKITINDIAEDCGISRMTFYYHSRTYMTLWNGLRGDSQKNIGRQGRL